MLPSSPDRHMVTPADLAQCRQMIRDGSKTFYTASLLLPQRVCDAARSLYAFCRVADDLVDYSADSRAAVDQLLVMRGGRQQAFGPKDAVLKETLKAAPPPPGTPRPPGAPAAPGLPTPLRAPVARAREPS